MDWRGTASRLQTPSCARNAPNPRNLRACAQTTSAHWRSRTDQFALHCPALGGRAVPGSTDWNGSAQPADGLLFSNGGRRARCWRSCALRGPSLASSKGYSNSDVFMPHHVRVGPLRGTGLPSQVFKRQGRQPSPFLRARRTTLGSLTVRLHSNPCWLADDLRARRQHRKVSADKRQMMDGNLALRAR